MQLESTNCIKFLKNFLLFPHTLCLNNLFALPPVYCSVRVVQVACCFGSAACSLCCAACPSCKNSSASRIAYAALLLTGTVVACIMLNPGVGDLPQEGNCGHLWDEPGINQSNI